MIIEEGSMTGAAVEFVVLLSEIADGDQPTGIASIVICEASGFPKEKDSVLRPGSASRRIF